MALATGVVSNACRLLRWLPIATPNPPSHPLAFIIIFCVLSDGWGSRRVGLNNPACAVCVRACACVRACVWARVRGALTALLWRCCYS
jgi:hypothetical protein